MRRVLCALTLLCGVASGCSGQPNNTKIFVVVWSDLTVPTEIDSIAVDVKSVTGAYSFTRPLTNGNETGKSKLPLVVALVPPDNQGLAFEVTASGYLAQTAIISQQARLSFLSGQSRVLTLFLGRTCRGVACTGNTTCSDGRCDRPIDVVPSNLPAYDPTTLLSLPDAGVAPKLDSGVEDGNRAETRGGTADERQPDDSAADYPADFSAFGSDGAFGSDSSPDTDSSAVGGHGGNSGADAAISTGGALGADAAISTGGALGSDAAISTGGSGGSGAGGSSGAGGRVVPDAAADVPGPANEVAPEARDAACGRSGDPCCAGSTCLAGGCCLANLCVANGATCSGGSTCSAGSCLQPASLSASTLSYDFGPVLVGRSSNVATLSIANTGQQASGKITVTSNSTGFAIQNGQVGDCVSGTTTLVANASCTVRVVFAPQIAGPGSALVTFAASPGGGAAVGFSGVGTCPVDQLSDQTGTCVAMAGVTWSQRGTSQGWYSVDSSADGTNMVAVVWGGYIYTSADSGKTWSQQGAARNWISVASSADGAKLVAATADANIYTSPDFGVTWVQRGAVRSWYAVASSADGTKLVALVKNGYVFTSADSGATWIQRGTSQPWSCVASSADGTNLVAGTHLGYLFTSGDSGVTWTQRAASRAWVAVASSTDGAKVVALDSAPGYIYTSVDAGVTWTQQGTSQTWKAVASSANGTDLVALDNGPGYIYTSVDAGVTWTQRGTSQTWKAVASSADGTKLVALDNGGYIYTSSGPVP